MLGNEELKKMIRDMMLKGVGVGTMGNTNTLGGTVNNTFGDLGKFRPPQPTVGVDGGI